MYMKQGKKNEWIVAKLDLISMRLRMVKREIDECLKHFNNILVSHELMDEQKMLTFIQVIDKITEKIDPELKKLTKMAFSTEKIDWKELLKWLQGD